MPLVLGPFVRVSQATTAKRHRNAPGSYGKVPAASAEAGAGGARCCAAIGRSSSFLLSQDDDISPKIQGDFLAPSPHHHHHQKIAMGYSSSILPRLLRGQLPWHGQSTLSS